jgi:hypothetical protein
MNSHQQQLLQLLQIKPLQLYAGFQHFQPLSEHPHDVTNLVAKTSAVDQAIAESGQSTEQISLAFTALAADIQLAMQLYLPDFPWVCSRQLQQSALIDNAIHTPDLPALTDPFLKQQLWQLMLQQQVAPQVDQDASN